MFRYAALVDYRKFLSRAETAVAPYTGGPTVWVKGRKLRVKGEAEPGHWRFEITGRDAVPKERAAPELDALARVRGHFAGEWLFRPNEAPEHVELLPEEEIAPLSIVSARRTEDGELVYESTDFDGEAEDGARRALEEGTPLAEVKGVGASLRAAWAWAVVLGVARREEIQVALAEALPFLPEVGGEARALELARAIDARRIEHAVRVEGRVIDVGRVVRRMRQAGGPEPTTENAKERAEAALAAADARMLSARVAAQGRLEVAFRFRGQRFITVCDPITLQVIDAGICLVDHEDARRGDSELTLESLPSAIREAMDLHVLVITRR